MPRPLLRCPAVVLRYFNISLFRFFTISLFRFFFAISLFQYFTIFRSRVCAVGRQVVDVPKLEDAHWAGTAKSAQCTLILTEGDSAKALAVAGLEVRLVLARLEVLPLAL